jgi:RimJ/RimL family protein N-acetyltransferase
MDRPIGPIVADWKVAVRPADLTFSGYWTQLRPLDALRDAPGLWDAFKDAPWVWDYLFEEPPLDFATFETGVKMNAARTLQPCYVIGAASDPKPLGYACFWAVVPEMGTIEIGNVNLSPTLQQTPVATEAFFLMIDWAFANGYRRMEWKCNALNAPSRKAAQRMGFSYEGIFRNHSVVKGRSRDTAWFAITDSDWRKLRAAFVTWLAAENFDGEGRQKVSLADLTRPHLFKADPFT